MASGLVANQGLEDPETEKSLRRARWTSELSLVLPGVMVLLLNLALWWSVLEAGIGWLGPTEGAGGSVLRVTDVTTIRHIFDMAVPPLYSFWLVVMLLALVATLWAVWPAVRGDSHRRDARGSASEWLGRSLTSGFRVARFAGELLRWLLLAGLLLSVWWRWIGAPGAWLEDWHSWLQLFESWWILLVGAGVLGAALGRGPLSFLAFGFRSALDIAFDVVNWLRHDPPGRTPSGRIVSRYHSLLRHLDQWKHPIDGGGYDAIVVVAHSQGAVITADFFHYLND